MYFIFLFFLSFLISNSLLILDAESKTLKTTALLYPQEPVFIFGWESDLFIEPLETKGATFKSYQIDLDYPVINASEWKPLVLIKAESTSIAQPGLTVGNDRVLINKAMLYRAAGLGLVKTMNDQGYLKFVALYESASDDPFINQRDKHLDLNFQYISALRNDGQWVVMISHTKNRGYLNNKTIPLVGYRFIFNQEISTALGFGFFELQWHPTPADSVVFAAEPVGYTLNYTKKLPLNLLWINEAGLAAKSFLHSERVDDDMRLFLEQKYMKTGFELGLSEKSHLGVDFGFVYDRKLYEAKQVFLPIGQEKLFAQEWYGGFIWRFQL